jgi:hypothetical protein
MVEDEDLDPELVALAWEFIAQEWGVLRKMCQIAVGRRRTHKRVTDETWEEAMSEVAVHLPRILWTYDPTKGTTLRSHVIGACRWYLYKHFVSSKVVARRRQDQLENRVSSTCGSSCYVDSRDDRDNVEQVQLIVQKVHPFHAAMVRLYFMCGMTYEEIGGVLECSKSCARIRVVAAIAAVKEACGQR